MVKEFNGNLTVTASSIDNSPLFVVDNNNFSIQVIGTVTGDLQLEESLDREGPWAIVKDSKITAEGETTIFNVHSLSNGIFIRVGSAGGSGNITRIIYKS